MWLLLLLLEQKLTEAEKIEGQVKGAVWMGEDNAFPLTFVFRSYSARRAQISPFFPVPRWVGRWPIECGFMQVLFSLKGGDGFG